MVPNGGRSVPEATVLSKGTTPEGKKTVGLESQTKFWPTTTVKDAENAARHSTKTGVMHPGTTLIDAINLWRTPDTPTPGGGPRTRQASVGKGHQVVLAEQASSWPTPREAEYKDCGPHGSKSQVYRLEKHYLDATSVEFHASHPDLTTSSSGAPCSPPIPISRRRLNPAFVEWLMNWPINWTVP